MLDPSQMKKFKTSAILMIVGGILMILSLSSTFERVMAMFAVGSGVFLLSWLRNVEPKLKKCAFCTLAIPKEAIRCPKCAGDLSQPPKIA